MRNNILEYKGYRAKIEVDTASLCLRGRIEGINDYVDFEATDLDKVEEEFRIAVDEYLEFCKEVGKAPDTAEDKQFAEALKPVGI